MEKKTTFSGREARYTVDMVFATVQKAQNPVSQAAKIAAWTYAGILSALVVAQLFAFEKLVPLFHDMAFPGGDGTGSLLICLIVFAEVFAIPFLLRMPLSILMRWCSMIFGVIAPMAWFGVTLWLLCTHPSTVVNGGILGTKVGIVPSAQLALAIALLLLSLWAAWGLWPSRKK